MEIMEFDPENARTRDLSNARVEFEVQVRDVILRCVACPGSQVNVRGSDISRLVGKKRLSNYHAFAYHVANTPDEVWETYRRDHDGAMVGQRGITLRGIGTMIKHTRGDRLADLQALEDVIVMAVDAWKLNR